GDVAGRRDKAEAGQRGHRLAATGFSHQTHHLALDDTKIAAPDRLHRLLEAAELDVKVGYLEKSLAHAGAPGRRGLRTARLSPDPIGRIRERFFTCVSDSTDVWDRECRARRRRQGSPPGR